MGEQKRKDKKKKEEEEKKKKEEEEKKRREEENAGISTELLSIIGVCCFTIIVLLCLYLISMQSSKSRNTVKHGVSKHGDRRRHPSARSKFYSTRRSLSRRMSKKD